MWDRHEGIRKNILQKCIILCNRKITKNRTSDRVRNKMKKLCRNFQEYYPEQCIDVVEKMLDYAEISTINKAEVDPSGLSNV